MTYKINGVDLELQPEAGTWIPRDVLGIDGNGHPIYPALRQFELYWGMVSMSEFEQLQTTFSNNHITGTVVVDLPKYGHDEWLFQAYSGSVVHEPVAGPFFEQHYTDVRLLVTGIRT